MNILVTNDDGIYAPGIYALVQELKKISNVTVVAPDQERSAVGHAITLSDPLRVWKTERDGTDFGYAVNGTPADCVKLGANVLLKKKPDLVVSGINQGANTGTNVIYSGTVSAATEGIILNIPSLAISLSTPPYPEKPDFKYAAQFARKLCLVVFEKGLPPETLLNVNVPHVPKVQIQGVAICRQGRQRWIDIYQKRVDPRNRVYYWLKGEREEIASDGPKDSDHLILSQNKIAVTPIHLDLTNYRMLDELKTWDFEL